MVPRSAASVLPGTLLERQILGPHPGPLESETWSRADDLRLDEPQGLDVCWRWRTVGAVSSSGPLWLRMNAMPGVGLL